MCRQPMLLASENVVHHTMCLELHETPHRLSPDCHVVHDVSRKHRHFLRKALRVARLGTVPKPCVSRVTIVSR